MPPSSVSPRLRCYPQCPPRERLLYTSLAKDERYRADYRAQALIRAAALGVATRPVFVGLASESNAAEYEAVKKAMLLVDWIAELPTKDLETRYHVWAGGIRRIGEEYGWIVDALGEIALACGWSKDRAAALGTLADRLTHGVREDAVAVARIRVRGLGRTYLRRLVDAGLRTRDELRAAGPDAVRDALRNKAAFSALWAALGRKVAAGHLDSIPLSRTRAADTDPPLATAPEVALLTVNLAERRVIYRGIEIPTRPPRNLQRQPLLALAVLAEHAGQSITVVDLADEMQRIGGLGRRLVAPEARDLRYKMPCSSVCTRSSRSFPRKRIGATGS